MRGLAYSLCGPFVCLTCEATLDPPTSATGHARPPANALKKVKCARDVDVAGGIRMACVIDTRAHEHGYINARREGGRQGRGVSAIEAWSKDEESGSGVHLEETRLVREV